MHYLDNAATTWPKPEAVYQALDDGMRHMMSPKRGTSSASRGGGEKLQACRQTLARFFNIADPQRVVFTSGCTHSLNLAIQAFPWKAGDGVVMSAIEHHALSRPIRKMVREKGIEFYIIPYTDDVPFDLAQYETLLKTKPNLKLVATTHSSNVIGSVLPVADIGRLAKDHGLPYLVDAAQTAGVFPIDVQAMGIDLLALPGHKSLYGPPGVGALYIGPDVQLNTFMEGGTGNDSGRHEMSPTPPDGFEVGTISLPLIQAFATGVDWVSATGLAKIHDHEASLLATLLEGLKALPEVTVYGHTRVAEKTPVVSFNVKGFHPKDLGERLFDEFGIALRAGFHCAPMAHEALGTIASGGTVRASIGWYTTPEDVQAFLTALKQVLQTQATPTLAT